jgi:hypothetical protein
MPPDEPPAALVDEARALLAEQVGVAETDLAVASTSQQTWDESLGCPRPNRAYAEFAQFGYLLIFEGGGQSYNVHSSQTGDFMIHCDQGTPRLLAGSQLPGR